MGIGYMYEAMTYIKPYKFTCKVSMFFLAPRKDGVMLMIAIGKMTGPKGWVYSSNRVLAGSIPVMSTSINN